MMSGVWRTVDVDFVKDDVLVESVEYEAMLSARHGLSYPCHLP